MNHLLLFIIIILLICYCIKNKEGFGIGGQLVIPDLVPRIFYPELNLNSSNICEDKREWKNGELDCLDYSFEGTDCDDTGDDGTTAKKSCPISCNSCDDTVLTRKNYESTNEFSDNKMLERLPSPVSEFDGDLNDYGVFGPIMGDELRTGGEADSYADLYKEDFSKIFERIDELFDITSSQSSGSGGVLPGCDILESQTFDPNSYEYLKGYNINYDNQFKYDENDGWITYTDDDDPNKDIDEFSFYKLSCDDTDYYYDCNSKQFKNENNQLRPITELVRCSTGEQYEIKFMELTRNMDQAKNEKLKEQIAYMVNSQSEDVTVTSDNIIINDKQDGSLIVNFSIRDKEPIILDILNSLHRYSLINDPNNKYKIDSDIYYINNGTRQERNEFIDGESNQCCEMNHYYDTQAATPGCAVCPDDKKTHKIVCKNDVNSGSDNCQTTSQCFDYKGDISQSRDCEGVCTHDKCYFLGTANGDNPKKICGEKQDLVCPISPTGKLMKNNILKLCDEANGECTPENCCEEVGCGDIVYDNSGESVYIDHSIIGTNPRTWMQQEAELSTNSSNSNSAIPLNIMDSYNIIEEGSKYSLFLDNEQKTIVDRYKSGNNFKKICGQDETDIGKRINHDIVGTNEKSYVISECCSKDSAYTDCRGEGDGLEDRGEFIVDDTYSDSNNTSYKKYCKNKDCDMFKYRKINNEKESGTGNESRPASKCGEKNLLVLFLIIFSILVTAYIFKERDGNNLISINKSLREYIFLFLLLFFIILPLLGFISDDYTVHYYLPFYAFIVPIIGFGMILFDIQGLLNLDNLAFFIRKNNDSNLKTLIDMIPNFMKANQVWWSLGALFVYLLYLPAMLAFKDTRLEDDEE